MKKIFFLPVLALAIMVTVSLAACSSGDNASNGPAGQQLTSSELYRQALEASISLGSVQPYMSFQLDAGSIKFKGEAKGDLNQDNMRMKADMDIKDSSQGIPISMTVEMIGIKEPGKDDSYMKFNSVSTRDSQYSSSLQAYFAPAINRWVKSDTKDSKSGPPKSFEEDGPTASFSAMSMFVPILSLGDSDKQVFLAAVDNGLYQVGDVQTTQFNGAKARLVTVTMDKDALLKIDDELSQNLSPDAKFKRSELKFIEELFGKDNKLSANIYLDPDNAKIIGIDLKINLDSAVTDPDFDASISSVAVSASFDYNRDLIVTAPESFMTETEMDALMQQQSS